MPSIWPILPPLDPSVKKTLQRKENIGPIQSYRLCSDIFPLRIWKTHRIFAKPVDFSAMRLSCWILKAFAIFGVPMKALSSWDTYIHGKLHCNQKISSHIIAHSIQFKTGSIITLYRCRSNTLCPAIVGDEVPTVHYITPALPLHIPPSEPKFGFPDSKFCGTASVVKPRKLPDCKNPSTLSVYYLCSFSLKNDKKKAIQGDSNCIKRQIAK